MITKELLHAVRDDAKKALEDVAKKHGLCLDSQLNISYEFDSFYFKKIEFREGTKEDAEKREFERVCGAFGFTPNDYLSKFTHKGVVYELFGFKLGGRVKNPIFLRHLGTNAVYTVSSDFAEYFKRIN